MASVKSFLIGLTAATKEETEDSSVIKARKKVEISTTKAPSNSRKRKKKVLPQSSPLDGQLDNLAHDDDSLENQDGGQIKIEDDLCEEDLMDLLGPETLNTSEISQKYESDISSENDALPVLENLDSCLDTFIKAELGKVELKEIVKPSSIEEKEKKDCKEENQGEPTDPTVPESLKDESVPDGKFICVECLFKAAKKTLLVQHLIVEHSYSQKSMTECTQCQRIYSNKQSLETHQKNVHGYTNGQIVCDICNIEFRHSYHLQVHQESVHRINSYQCEECGKKFPTMLKLKFHYRIVHDKRISTAKLPKNRKTITEICDLCQKTFRGKGSAKRHKELIHSDKDLSQICDHCGNTYANKNALRSHVKAMHGNREEYQCQQCEYKGNSTGSLYVHVTLKHEGKKLPCGICDFEAHAHWALKEHRRSHKPGADKELKAKKIGKSRYDIHLQRVRIQDTSLGLLSAPQEDCPWQPEIQV